MFHSEKKTLQFVNELRGKAGLRPLAELPPGKRGDPHGCVIQRALSIDSNLYVRTTNDYTQISGERIIHPLYVRRFIRLFDNGWKNHLDGRKNLDGRSSNLVYADKVMSRKEKREMKQEMVEIERTMRLDALEKQLEGLLTRHEALESSFIATSQNLRNQIRALREEQADQKSKLRDMLHV